MIRRLYEWMLRMAEHPQALWVLAFVAFIESSVFPIPPDVLMIPMILARPSRAWLIAGVALAASVLGGLLGYAIGALAYEQIGQPVLAALGKGDAIAEFNTRFNDLGFWAVLVAGVTPFPYKVITIMSGWTGMSWARSSSPRFWHGAFGSSSLPPCCGSSARRSKSLLSAVWA